MILSELKKVDSQIPELNKFQGYVKDQFALLNAPFLRGRFLTEITNGLESDLISIPTTDKSFEHKLGRDIVGYIIIDLRANAVIWRSSVSSPDTVLTLRANTAATAKVWVF